MSTCLECGETFEPFRMDQEFCTRLCRQRRRRAEARERRRQADLANNRLCSYSECVVSLAGERSDKLFCSALCIERDKRERRRLSRPKSWRPKRGGTRSPRPGARKHSPGDRFGDLTLIEYVAADRNGSRGRFQCSCGSVTELAIRNLSSGATTHCSNHPKEFPA